MFDVECYEKALLDPIHPNVFRRLARSSRLRDIYYIVYCPDDAGNLSFHRSFNSANPVSVRTQPVCEGLESCHNHARSSPTFANIPQSCPLVPDALKRT